MVNNADWLLDLNYVEFLREVGVHFSVNRISQLNVLNLVSRGDYHSLSSTTC